VLEQACESTRCDGHQTQRPQAPQQARQDVGTKRCTCRSVQTGNKSRNREPVRRRGIGYWNPSHARMRSVAEIVEFVEHGRLLMDPGIGRSHCSGWTSGPGEALRNVSRPSTRHLHCGLRWTSPVLAGDGRERLYPLRPGAGCRPANDGYRPAA
jgi:hypothetical protein